MSLLAPPAEYLVRPVAADAAGRHIAIVGMGYVGLPTALAFLDRGANVTGIDISSARLDEIRTASADLLADDRQRLRAALRSPLLRLTSDAATMAAADTVIICVPTPVDEHLIPDLVRAAGGLCHRGRAGPARADHHADLDDLRRQHPRPARHAAGRARPGGRPGRLRRVRPRAHRPGKRLAPPGAVPAGRRRRHRRRAPRAPRRCSGTSPRWSTRSLGPRPRR